MTIVFARETVDDFHRDALELTALHYDEIAPFPDLYKLKPDWAAYHNMERAGALVVITARENGERMVGYFVMAVRKHPHYCDVMTAVEDFKFVHPNYRGGTGMKMIKFAERVARDFGCKVILQRSKAKSGHGAMYARLGYELMDEVYIKRLDRESADGY